MNWTVQYTRTFLKEMAGLPVGIRTRVEAFAFGNEIQDDPSMHDKVQKLKGYQNYYRLRIGDYRVGLRIDSESHVVEFCRVLHRKEIYRKFP